MLSLSRMLGRRAEQPRRPHVAMGPHVTPELVLEALADLPATPGQPPKARMHVDVAVPRPGSHFTADGELHPGCVDAPLTDVELGACQASVMATLRTTLRLAYEVDVTRVTSTFSWGGKHLRSVGVSFAPESAR